MSKRKSPIFIHSLFRSGSTYIFNVFRNSSSGLYCYQEPFNETLICLNNNPQKLLEASADMENNLRHPVMSKPYYWEFYQIKSKLKGLFYKSFSYDDFFVNETYVLDEKQKVYISSLITNARGRPVFQFCRSSGRIAALKDAYDGVHIHLWRSPRNQWWSFKIIAWFDFLVLLIYNARNLPPPLLEVKILCGISDFHDENIENEIKYAKKHPLDSRCNYFAFFSLWLYAYIEGEKHSDISISIDRLSLEPEYSFEIINHLSKCEINDIDFKDCEIPQFYFTHEEKSFYEEIENRVVDIFFENGYKKDVLDNAIYAHRKLSEERDSSTNSAVLLNNLFRARETTLRFIDQTKETEFRAGHAEDQMQQSEARAEHAEVEAHQAEARAEHAEAQAQQAEARTEHAEAQAQQSEARAGHAEAQAQQAEARAGHAEAQAQQAEARAKHVMGQLDAVFNSHSWRVTEPLRLIGRILQWFLSLPLQFLRWAKRLIKKMLRPIILWIVSAIQDRPRIKVRVNALLRRFPYIYTRLKISATNSCLHSQANVSRHTSYQAQAQNGFENKGKIIKNLEQFVPVYNIDVYIDRIYKEIELHSKKSDIESKKQA